MKLLNLLLASTVFLFMVTAFAQSPSPAPTVAAPGATVLAGMQKASSAIPTSLPAAVLMGITFLVSEAAAHGIPTTKPLSWFLAIAAMFGVLVTIFQKLQNLCQVIGNSGQNLSSS